MHKESLDLSGKIISLETFQHASLQNQYALFGVPIKTGKEVVGSLIAHSSNCAKPKDAGQMEVLLAQLAGLIEDAWESKQEIQLMAEELTQSFEDLYLYSRIASKIRMLHISKTMLNKLILELMEAMRVEMAFTQLPNYREYNTLVNTKKAYDKIPDLDSFADSLIKTIPGNASSLGENYFIVNNSRVTPGYKGLHTEPYRFLAVAMEHNNTLYGWLGLVAFNVKEIFRRSELRLLRSMAEQIAMVIANADLYSDFQRFVISVVKSLVYAIEAKDEYTRGHSERVSRFSMLMAERLDLDEEQESVLHWAAILHDIGKIGIPETILNKTGALNDEEYEIIKGHPVKGYNILRPLEQLSDSLPGILHHHERYDGKGYPHGLKGEDIPLQARIIAVADTFDALTSSRAYRSARSTEEALAVVEKGAGTQLDPDLVGVFKEVYGVDSWEEEDNHGT